MNITILVIHGKHLRISMADGRNFTVMRNDVIEKRSLLSSYPQLKVALQKVGDKITFDDYKLHFGPPRKKRKHTTVRR